MLSLNFFKKRRLVLIFTASLVVLLIFLILSYLAKSIEEKPSLAESASNKIKDSWFCEDKNRCFDKKEIYKKYIKNQTNHTRLLIANSYLTKLNKTRDEIRKRAKETAARIILGDKDKYYVPAIFIGDGKIYKVSIRFRGDDFLSRVDSPITFKVDIKDKKNTHFRGMREFPIEDVRERGGSFGIFIQQKLHQEGNFVPRYYLKDTYLNDKLVKNILYFESFSKENQEYNGRLESFIYRHSGDISWSQRSIFSKYISANQSSKAKKVYVSGDIVDASNAKRKYKSKTLQKRYEDGYKLLFGYLKGYLTFEEVFNVESFIPQIFYSDLLCEPHGFVPDNIFYYYNPIIRKLEPIVFDRSVTYSDRLYKQNMKNCNIKSYSVPRIISSVKENYEKEYKEYAKKVLNQFNNGDLKNHKRQVENLVKDSKIFSNSFIKRRLEYLSKEKYENKHKDLLHKRNRPNISDSKTSQVETQDYLIAYPLFIYISDSDRYIYKYTIQNNLKTDVYLENIYYFNKSGKKQFIISGEKRISPNKKFGQLQTLFKASKKKVNVNKIFYDSYYYNKNGKKMISTKIPVFPHVEPFKSYEDLKYQSKSAEETLKEFKFLRLDSDKKIFSIIDGKHEIAKSIILPDGYSLHIKSSSLKFREGVRVVLRKAPIKIINSNLKAKNKKDGWMGLIILQSEEKSIIQDSNISDIKYIDGDILKDDWMLTGAIVFYESDVDIIRSDLRDNNTEDLLNIIRSKFLLQDSTLSGSPSDAFDSDFSNGKIVNTDFKNIKGDAVDMSGSDIEMIGGVISNIYDKALSIGEKSNFSGKNIKVENSGSGLVVKDGSMGQIENSTFNKIEGVVYMSFIKKSEYDGAKLFVKNSKATNYKEFYELSSPSALTIDGKKMKDKGTDLKSLYEQGRFKKIKW